MGRASFVAPKRFWWIVAGLVASGIWVNLIGYNTAFLEPGTADSSFEMTRYAYHFGRLAAGLAFLVFARSFGRMGQGMRIGVPLVLFFGTLMYVLSYYQNLFPPVMIGSASSFALGFGYMWLVTTFYVLFARTCTFSQALFGIAVSQIIEQVASSAANLLPSSSVQIALCCLCPLVAMLCLAHAGSGKKAAPADAPCLSGLARSHQIVLLATTSAAGVGITAASNVGVWGSVRAEFVEVAPIVSVLSTVCACVVVAALVRATLARADEKPIGFRYQIPFLVIVAGSLIVVMRYLTAAEPSFVFSAALTGVEFFAHVLTWTIIVSAVQNTEMAAYRVAGVAHSVYGITSLAWIAFFEPNETLSCLAILVISFLVIVAIAVHPRLIYSKKISSVTTSDEMNEYQIEGEPAIPLEANGVAVSDMVARRCELLGDRYGLSKRERQVFSLLAKGRSGVEVQRRLVLSEGTAKTHVSHIYKKLGVTSHQQLLDIVYEEADDSSKRP